MASVTRLAHVFSGVQYHYILPSCIVCLTYCAVIYLLHHLPEIVCGVYCKCAEYTVVSGSFATLEVFHQSPVQEFAPCTLHQTICNDI